MTRSRSEASVAAVSYALRSCDRTSVIRCHDHETAALVGTTFGSLFVPPPSCEPAGSTHYDIGRSRTCDYYVVESGGTPETFDNGDALLFHLDKRITLTLQRERPDLYFVHAAAVALHDRVAVLAAPAGTGKSTLALALLEKRFAYLSDELTPIEPETLLVHTYPRALCLKAPPPAPHRLPQGTLDTGARLHVPVDRQSALASGPLPLGALFFLKRPGTASPVRLSTAGGAAYVMANALNSAAHPDDGLDVAIRLSSSVPCFELDCTNLEAACSTIAEVLSESCSPGRRSSPA